MDSPQPQVEPPRASVPPPPTSRTGARLCAIHGIVLGPFGRCVICQRAEEDAAADPTGSRKAMGALLVLLIALGGVLLYKGVAGKPDLPVITAPSGFAPPTEAPAIEERAAEDAKTLARIQAAVEQKQAAFDAARGKVVVRVYTTSWCTLCGTAREWMKSKKIAFTELDVQASPENLAGLRKVNPESTVPTFVVDGEVLVGFGPGAIQGAIYRAAEKRVR